MAPHVFGLYGEELAKFREALDGTIRALAVNMTERGMAEGSVSAKIKITIQKGDSGGKLITRMKIEPAVGMKIGASEKVKIGTENGIVLEYDSEGRPVVGNHQIEVSEYIRQLDAGEQSA